MKKLFAYFFLCISLIALAINISGFLFKLSPSEIKEENLRFENDQIYTYEDALEHIRWTESDSKATYAQRLNSTIAGRLAHVHWEKYPPTRFNQTVPVWENYILYLAGKLSNIPEFERYHFSDPYRSLERGIGICGDASMNLSKLLDNEDVANTIISFPGHVIVEVEIAENIKHVFDPDFNVILPYSIEEINAQSDLIIPFYEEKSYSEKEINNLVNKYELEFKRWQGVEHFITKKYYFEYASYFLIWILPFLFFLLFLKLRK